MMNDTTRDIAKELASDLYVYFIEHGSPTPATGKPTGWDQVWVDKISVVINEAEERGLLDAAFISDTFTKGYDIGWWYKQTKKELSATICRDVAEKIREKAKELEASPLNQNGGKR